LAFIERAIWKKQALIKRSNDSLIAINDLSSPLDKFDTTYNSMKADGLKADAMELKTPTVHWLHHTGIKTTFT